MAMLAGPWGFALAGKSSAFLICAAFTVVSLPVSALSETFGAWQFGKINGVCAVASQSVDASDARRFNIMVTNDDRILIYIALGDSVPSGARHFGMRVSGQLYWQIGIVRDGALLFDLSAHPESSKILTEIIDGSFLTLFSGLGDTVGQYSLSGSGQAVARLVWCVEEGR